MSGRTLFLLAGEASGDVLGARLMAALRAIEPDIRIIGVGGERMSAAGLRSLFTLDDIAVMGLLQVVPRLPTVLRRIRQTRAAVIAAKPDALITIDSPSFSLRVARAAKRAGIPAIHYVAPQYWAWRAGRMKHLRAKIDHLLALFPFEPAFFAGAGVGVSLVGHPAIETPRGDGARFRASHRIDPAAPVLAVLPGSRASVVRRMLPLFRAAVARMKVRPCLVVPTIAARRDDMAEILSWGLFTIIVDDVAEKAAALAAADAALTVSGTITTELAVAGVPMVVAYKADDLSARLARRLITVKYVAMPNLILDRPLVPEFLQWDCDPAKIAAAVDGLLAQPAIRSAQKAGLAQVARALGAGEAPPSMRAARAILEKLGPQRG